MAYIGITTRNGVCAICKNDLPIGIAAYHDPTKRQGAHLAHRECWDTLRATRGYVKPEKKPILSTEPLDPPF